MPFSLPLARPSGPIHRSRTAVCARSTICARRVAAVLGLALALALPAGARAQSDSGLGLIAGEVRLEAQTGGDAGMGSVALGSIWQIGSHHLLQLDLGAAAYDSVRTGRIAGHLSLQTAPGRKYGLFGVYEDVDEAAVQSYLGGVEAMWALAPGLRAEGQLGAGVVQPASTDFLFGAGRLTRAAGAVEFAAGYQIAAIDELEMGLTVHSVDLGVARVRGPLRLGAALRHDRITGSGRGADHRDTALVLSVGWRFGGKTGQGGDQGVGGRLFHTPRPVAPLWRAGVMRF